MAYRSVRYSFAAGLLGPELRWRSDLERYQSACLELSNFMVQPWGSVTRRPGLAAVQTVDDRATPPAGQYRVLPFEAGTDERYLVVLRPHDADTTDVLVYGDDGALKESLEWALAPATLSQVQYCQANDVMWLVHALAAPLRLERYGDEDWRVRAQGFLRGPWLPENDDPRKVLTPIPAKWSNTDTYAAGACVYLGGTLKTLTGTVALAFGFHEELPDGTFQDVVYEEFACATHGYAVDDQVVISGTTNYNGLWTVVEVPDAGHFRICARVGVAEAMDSSKKVHAVGAFYASLSADNVGHAVTDTTYWRPTATVQGSVTLQAHSDVFEAAWVGRRIKIEQPRTVYSTSTNWEYTVPAVDPTKGEHSVATKSVRLETKNYWLGTVRLLESLDGGVSWHSLGMVTRSTTSDAQANILREVTRPGAVVKAWAEVTGHYGSADDPHWLTAIVSHEEGTHDLYVTVTGYTDARHVTVSIDGYMAVCTGSMYWSEIAFSDERGWPRAVCIWDERLVMAGSAARPQTVYMSALGDWDDWEPGELETSPVEYTLASDARSQVRWLVPAGVLRIGTDSGEYTLGSPDDEGVSPTKIRVERHTAYGSDPVQALAFGDVVAFVQRQGERVRAMAYSADVAGYVAPDVTLLAGGVLDGGAVGMAVVRAPNPVLWVVCGSGALASYTYDRENGVQGWARHSTEGTVLDVCGMSGDSSDALWCLVQREDVVYLERAAATEDADLAAPYLDWRHSASDADHVHLLADPSAWAVPVEVWLDGVQMETPADYSLVTESGATRVQLAGALSGEIEVGLGYVSRVDPTPLVPPPADGGSPGGVVRTADVDVFLYRSREGEASSDGGTTWDPLDYDLQAMPYSGRLRVRINSGYRDEAQLCIRTSGALALTVCAVGYGLRRYD